MKMKKFGYFIHSIVSYTPNAQFGVIQSLLSQIISVMLFIELNLRMMLIYFGPNNSIKINFLVWCVMERMGIESEYFFFNTV